MTIAEILDTLFLIQWNLLEIVCDNEMLLKQLLKQFCKERVFKHKSL